MTATSPFEIVRPFLWIAAVAFTLGFAGYVLMGAGGFARPSQDHLHISPIAAPQPAPVAGPTISA